jgi:hypothetical protein
VSDERQSAFPSDLLFGAGPFPGVVEVMPKVLGDALSFHVSTGPWCATDRAEIPLSRRAPVYTRAARFSLEEVGRMRMLLRVSIPVEAGNAAAKAGTLGTTIEKILGDLKPEAAYFFADDSGQRSGSMVFDLKDPSEIPAVAEPWFLAFNAQVSLRPVMSPQDLAKAVPAISKATKEFAK